MTTQNLSLAQQIRQDVKALGYSSKQVSVKNRDSRYNTSVTITIRDLRVDPKKLKEIASSHEEIRYDQYTNEILEGANTFVSVNFDWELIRDAAKMKMQDAQEIIEKNKDLPCDSGKSIFDRGLYDVVYYREGRNGPQICLLKKPEDYKSLTCFCLDTIQRHTAHNAHAIAEALVYIENYLACNE